MSAFRSNVSSASRKQNVCVQVSMKPFCKHCENLQLDTNHWLYSNGVLVCPVLKNTECTNCHKKGHTKSRCTARIETAPVKSQKKREQKQPMSAVLRNKYAAFLEEEEEEEKRAEEHNKQFPVLCSSEGRATEACFSNKPSYSTILAKAAPAPAPAPALEPTKSVELSDYVKSLLSFKKKNWADYSDSEDDDYFEK